ncbi:MAG TPA: hypothetical protein VG871_17800 [Vicinamibacterales bacterium]|nr:hypothetical protein [Vicinamibacterales bacterium]
MLDVQPIIRWTFLLLGAGFLAANARLGFEYLRYVRRRRGAVLTWRGPKPPHYVLQLAIGVFLGVILMYNVLRLHRNIFGEAMMFVYYGYLFPLTQTIERGFYEDGIWADSAFLSYHEIGGISWRESEHEVVLILTSRLRNIARRLIVPGNHYAAARRLLRDKIAKHDIHFTGTGLDLLDHDEREDV